MEIMHDSRMGTFGALGVILTLMLKFAFICAALERLGMAALGLTFAAPVLSRMCVVLLEKIGVSARDGMGSAYVKGMSWRRVLEAYALGAVLILLVKPAALLGAPAACVLALGFNSYFNRKIGGLNRRHAGRGERALRTGDVRAGGAALRGVMGGQAVCKMESWC